MDYQQMMDAVFSDFDAICRANPNERLPKEEQTRCCIYAFLRPREEVVCVERGYRSIDDGGKSECDVWARSKNGDQTWMEIKHCWSVKDGINRPALQLKSWKTDVAKLRGAPKNSVRCFVLVGFLDFDPSGTKLSTRSFDFMKMIDGFCPCHVVRVQPRPFSWCQWHSITHVAAWIWTWRKGECIEA